MARNRRKAGTAAEHNEEVEQQRQAAREADTNVVTFEVKDETRAQQLRDITAEFNRLKSEGQRINAERKAQLERIDALGLDRAEFKAAVKLLEVDDDKRTKKQRTRREFLRAHNLPEQVDMFEPKEPEPGSIPGLERPFIVADEQPARDPAVQAAVDAGFLTEEELEESRQLSEVANRWDREDAAAVHEDSGDAYDDMLAEAQDEDQPADDDDDELFQRAGVATIVAGDDE